jgi:arsenate reductase-like glutaredoxin family protein
MQENEQITRFLPCKLTEEEVKAKAVDLATTITDLEDLQDEFEKLKKTMSEQIKSKEKEYKRLAVIVRDKIENREVECYLRRVDDKLIMQVIRADTYEVVQTRPMTDGERQLVMFPTRPRLEQVAATGTDPDLPIPTVGERMEMSTTKLSPEDAAAIAADPEDEVPEEFSE